MLTLDEAIKHCEEKADELNKEVLNQANLCNAREMAECQECAREHEQLAEWLKDYKRLLEMPKGDCISRSECEKLGATCLARRNESGELEAIISLDLAPTVEPFTQLEKEEITDAITYLLDAELLEENGYTEEVIKALKSALKKVGGAE